MLLSAFLWLLIVAWLPGAVLFRAPFADRDRRAALPAEERLFWSVIASLAVSLSLTMILAAAGRYTFQRVAAIDVGLAIGIALVSRFRLRLGTAAPRPGPGAVVPIVLLLLAAWRFPPPAEYVMGGKDPGVYMNEGIQIAQRGSLAIRDEAVASVPPALRDLFFPSHQNPNYYGLRFMGFYIQDPAEGLVVGQFPHLYPASIALGYGIDGLTGARRATGFWAALGLVAVYFAGARVAGRAAGAAAAALLGLHVLQVWYARYPNSEIMMQPLLFAALLAADRALVDRSRFFAPLAGGLLGIQLTLRFEIVLAIGAVAAAAALGRLKRRPLPWGLIAPLAATAAVSLGYLVTLMSGYSYYPLAFARQSLLAPLAAGAALLAGLFWAARRPERAERAARIVPIAITALVLTLAAYAWFGRDAGGRTAIHDAYALRTFTWFYLSVPGLIAALAGFAFLAARRFWQAPALILTLAAFATFFFYKVRIVPEHFWMGRRFLAVILPGALLCICAIALARLRQRPLGRGALAAALGLVFLVLLGQRYARAAAPVLPHVEYAGIIPKMEELSARIHPDDLVVVEARDASDIHVLGLPLAYIYARQVLLLNTPVPDKTAFGAFLDWASARYGRVFFLGSGGTDLLSRRWSVDPVVSERFSIPEYETTPWNAYPRSVRQKEFDYGLYVFGPPRPHGPVFDLDIGVRDDLHVVRFHAKEQSEGRWMRWTSRTSYISVARLRAESRTVTLWMNDGGRPPAAAAAEVRVFLQERLLGTATVTTGFKPYAFTIPADAAAAAAADDVARLRLVSTLWNPHAVMGTGDDRELGVMVDRVRIE